MRVSTGRLRTDELTRGGVGPWWLFGVIGVVSLIAGVILITEPSHSLNALAVIFGIFLLFDGIVAIISALGDVSNSRAMHSVIGVLGVVVGIILIRHPEHAVSAVGLIIGLWLVAAGLVRLLLAFRPARAHLLAIAIAVLEVAVGIIIVSNPHIGYTTLAVIGGIWLILNAIGLIAVSFLIHGAATEARTGAAS